MYMTEYSNLVPLIKVRCLRLLRHGSTLRGDNGFYEIERVLLVSSMSLLYLGKSSNGEHVLIKTARIENDGKDQIRSNMLKLETEILNQISHENIVKFIDSTRFDNSDYLVMEFIPGRRMLEAYDGKPANIAMFSIISSRLLDTVGYLHSCGIVHRDINPKNILLDDDREIVVIDFGASLKLGNEWTRNIKVGSKGWSAPEQFERTPLAKPQSDMYAVGGVLFYLCTGEEPSKYLGKDGSMNYPTKFRSNVPSRIFECICKAMDPNPARRYLSAEEMKEDLIGLGASVKLEPETTAPLSIKLIFKDRSIQIEEPTIIGRKHKCGFACEVRGFREQPDIELNDVGKYVSKHHAKIIFDKGVASIVDVGSTNGTAIKRNGESFFSLSTNNMDTLQEGDEIALGYNAKKGPYLTFKVNYV